MRIFGHGAARAQIDVNVNPPARRYFIRVPGTAPARLSRDDDDPFCGVGLSREHLPIGGERRVAAATLIDRSQTRRNVHEGEPGLGDLWPERRSTPVGDAFLAAGGCEKALPFGASSEDGLTGKDRRSTRRCRRSTNT